MTMNTPGIERAVTQHPTPGLDARQIVDRAKASVMARRAMSEQQAFRWLQRAAMNHRTSIRAVADWVIRHQAPVTTVHPTRRPPAATLVPRSRSITLRSTAHEGP